MNHFFESFHDFKYCHGGHISVNLGSDEQSSQSWSSPPPHRPVQHSISPSTPGKCASQIILKQTTLHRYCPIFNKIQSKILLKKHDGQTSDLTQGDRNQEEEHAFAPLGSHFLFDGASTEAVFNWGSPCSRVGHICYALPLINFLRVFGRNIPSTILMLISHGLYLISHWYPTCLYLSLNGDECKNFHSS